MFLSEIKCKTRNFHFCGAGAAKNCIILVEPETQGTVSFWWNRCHNVMQLRLRLFLWVGKE
jgi:hypothetical protein